MLLAGQRQQPLGFLDVIHRLLGRLGVGLVSLDSARLLELLAGLLKTWVIDLGRHLVEPLQGVVRLFLDVLRLVGVVDLAFLAGVKIVPTLERAANRRNRNLNEHVPRVAHLILKNEFSPCRNDTIIKVCSANLE